MTSDPADAAAPIESERLVVRPFRTGDRAGAYRLWRDALNAGLGDDTLAWLSLSPSQLARLRQPPFGDRAVCLKETGALIGIAGLVAQPGPFALLDDPDVSDPPWTIEVGLYWCTHPDHRGRGFAAEAAGAMIDLARRTMNVARVVAITEHEHASSIAVMKRLGMIVHPFRVESAPWFQSVGVLALDV